MKRFRFLSQLIEFEPKMTKTKRPAVNKSTSNTNNTSTTISSNEDNDNIVTKKQNTGTNFSSNSNYSTPVKVIKL
jgi:hypothetical protein